MRALLLSARLTEQVCFELSVHVAWRLSTPRYSCSTVHGLCDLHLSEAFKRRQQGVELVDFSSGLSGAQLQHGLSLRDLTWVLLEVAWSRVIPGGLSPVFHDDGPLLGLPRYLIGRHLLLHRIPCGLPLSAGCLWQQAL